MYGLRLQIIICLTAATTALAQHKTNSLEVGVDYMSVDAPDNAGFHYNTAFSKYVLHDRLVLRSSLGYFSTPNQQHLPNQTYVEGEPRRRITFDVSALITVLKANHHAFRLGGGPSVWYRKDDLLLRASYTKLANGSITDLVLERKLVNEVNIGYHLTAEYEYLLNPSFSLKPRFMFVNFKTAGISSVLGLSLSHYF